MSVPASLQPIVILHGNSELLKRRALATIIPQALGEADPEYALEKLWANEAGAEAIIGALGGASLLAPERVVLVYDLDGLSNKDQKRLAGALGGISPGTTLVATTSPPEGRSDRRPKLAADLLKVLDKLGEVRSAFTPKEQELIPWVIQEARGQGKQMDSATARALLETAGADCDRLASEVDKLVTYVGDDPEITTETVRANASPADDRGVFDLVDAIGVKNLPLALEILKVLLPKEARAGSGLPLLGMVARHLRLLWQGVYLLRAHGSLQGPLDPAVAAALPQDTNLAEFLSNKGFLVGKYAQQAKNFTEPQLARALVKVYEADLALKGFGASGNMDDRMILETLVIALCRR